MGEEVAVSSVQCARLAEQNSGLIFGIGVSGRRDCKGLCALRALFAVDGA